MIKDNVQNKRSIIKKIKSAFIASLQDSRWPASHSLSENKRVRQEELQEEAGDWERKQDGTWERQLHEQEEAHDKWEKLGDREGKESEIKIKRHMEREQEEGRESWVKRHLLTLWMCLHDLQGLHHDIPYNTSNQCLRVFFLTQILMKEAHMPTESFNMQRVCSYLTYSWLRLYFRYVV